MASSTSCMTRQRRTRGTSLRFDRARARSDGISNIRSAGLAVVVYQCTPYRLLVLRPSLQKRPLHKRACSLIHWPGGLGGGGGLTSSFIVAQLSM